MKGQNKIDRAGIVCIAVALAITITMFCAAGADAGAMRTGKEIGYENRLFDTSKVHTIDIRIDDWEGFLSTCRSEEYTMCNVVIDGETIHNVGIRGKGNTSLSNVASMDSERYSFKIEFDQYDDSISYHGLDKLSLNNLIQDNTMMKDYLTYRMMNEFGVASPLCSYAYITVNGEDWGLYLAVEAVEDSFLERNYGTEHGDLYKPDSMQMGGGRGNGRDFDMESFTKERQKTDAGDDAAQLQPGGRENKMQGGRGGFGGGMPDFGGMGSSDVKLQYIDDDPSSYSTIFDSAKTVSTQADQARLIGALKTLSGDSPTDAVDAEQVMRYFVVHNYVVNGDSYTGSMVHNYYLYEEDGRLSMIPWDYNLAFGTFQGNQASSAVNDDIDAPLSVTGSDRPMIDWIFADEAMTAQYHALFEEFLQTVDVQALIEQAQTLISPYVERDPTKFCTYAEFENGVQTLSSFCSLRTQSVEIQLRGEKGSVDASALTLSDMGSMGGGKGGFMPQQNAPGRDSGTEPQKAPQMPGNAESAQGSDENGSAKPEEGMSFPQASEEGEFPQMPGGMDFPQASEEGEFPQMPDGMDFPEASEEGEFPQMPGGMDFPEASEEGEFPQMPGGMDFAQMSDNGMHAQQSGEGKWSLIISAAMLVMGAFFVGKYRRAH